MSAAAIGAGAIGLAATLPQSAAAAGAGSGLSPDQAFERLRAGNQRFVADRPNASDISTGRRLAVAKGQAPFAALVDCADSRVGPEHLFGAGLGELFIVRTAGNYVDDAGFGSLA